MSVNARLTCDPMGELTVVTASVTEAISGVVRAAVSALGGDDADLDGAPGQPAHLVIEEEGGIVRHFHFIVKAVHFEGRQMRERRRYNLELVHELYLLSLRADVRIFQDKDVKAIVSEVLEGAGVPSDHVSFTVQRSLQKREYCVQYRETDLDFASRLLEHEGIFYFAHDDASSTHLTFADAQSAFPPIEGDCKVPLWKGHGYGIHELVFESRPTPGKVTLSDYSFANPAVDLTIRQDTGGGPGDWFEYTAGHTTQAEGRALAGIRLDELLSEGKVGLGASDRLGLRAGSWFELEGAQRAALDGKYLLTEVEHVLERAHVFNRFRCIPYDRTYRPRRAAPRPVMRGAHSAVVTGPAGAEIHTDEHGRMKAKFFWDRLGKNDDQSSCWMRVGQLPIGGSMALARVGWEMAVVYLDGDPDRPTAVARLYNAEKTSPYSYPAAMTRMALQTPSSPGGGKSNEIRMEDGSGGMEFFANASKDYDGQVNNNLTETIAVDEKLAVGSDCEINVGASQKISVGGDESTTVGDVEGVTIKADRTKSVGGSESVTVGSGLAMKVGGSDTESTGGSHTTLAALGITRTSSSSHDLTVGGSLVSAAGAGVGVAIAGAKSETVGGLKLAMSPATVGESVVGALAETVGGVRVQAAGGNREGATKGAAAVTVGGVLCSSAGSKVSIKGKKVTIRVAGVANLLGGGAILNMTPGSVSFVGLVVLDASGNITISGNPNLAG
ncbi:type VI secretion system tip protein TssI/VgrG [Sorangium sp. So ce1014]|uniref:type VI secretion system Vgr family protein n=1 Tax=Sorangium sp. So ce1014 TaxID=3133326 RepID=UPI003F6371E8